jgi:TolA-binding protein
MYMKGVVLQKGGKRAEAQTEFRNLITKYPNHDTKRQAEARLEELQRQPATKQQKNKGGNKK